MRGNAAFKGLADRFEYRREQDGNAVFGELSTEQDERGWLLPYLDIATLLLTVFIAMLGVQATTVTDPDTELQRSPPVPTVHTEQGQQRRASAGDRDLDKAMRGAGRLAAELTGVIRRERLEKLVDIDIETHRVKLRIRDSILFPLAAADLTSAGLILLDKLVPVLASNRGRISVEGHTDPLPISTRVFPSNWELSAARASTVLRVLRERGIDAARLRAVGYADTQPIASNASAEGRAANRRVALVIYLGETNWEGQ